MKQENNYTGMINCDTLLCSWYDQNFMHCISLARSIAHFSLRTAMRHPSYSYAGACWTYCLQVHVSPFGMAIGLLRSFLVKIFCGLLIYNRFIAKPYVFVLFIWVLWSIYVHNTENIHRLLFIIWKGLLVIILKILPAF